MRLTSSIVSIVIFALLTVSTASGARPAVPHRAPRNDPIANAVAAVTLNSAEPTGNLHQACVRSDFKFLAIGLDGIRSRISQTKSEFETAAEFEARTHKMEEILNPAN